MSKYYFSKTLNENLESAEIRVRDALKDQGFGVLTEIDVAATLKKKLDVNFRPYKILGACNPHFAFKALSAEDKVGTMLPCNVILQKIGERQTEVAAIDPIASMQAVQSAELGKIAGEVQARLRSVIESL